MAGFWNKAMDYLGLSDNDAYGDYEPYEDTAPAPVRRPVAGAGRPVAGPGRAAAGHSTHVDHGAAHATADDLGGSVRTLPVDRGEGGIGAVVPQGRPMGTGSVRPLPPAASAKVHIVSPTSFAEAQEIGERFRSNQPVIVNLGGVDRDLKRRLVDFASGLTYGLNGDMKKVGDSVFMLTPSNVEVSADEKRRLQESGLYRD